MDDIFLLKRKMHAENLLEGNYDLSGIEPRTERVGNDVYVIYDIENTWLRSRTFVELIHYENDIPVSFGCTFLYLSRDMYEDIWNPSYMIMGDLWTKPEERRKGYATYCLCKLYEQGDKHGIGSCRCEADVDSPGRIFLEHCRRKLSEAYCEEYIHDQKYQLKIGGSEFFAQELQFTPTLIEK